MENKRDWTSELRWRVNGHLSKHWPAEIDEGAQNLFDRIMADIEVFGVLKAREAWRLAQAAFGATRTVNDVYPLPTRTRQVLREEPDPSGGPHTWKYSGDKFQVTDDKDIYRTCFEGNIARGAFIPTPARVDLWASLKKTPYRTEQLPADENNPWPDEAP